MHNFVDKLQELKDAQKGYRNEVAGKNRSKEVEVWKDKVYNLYQEIKKMNKDEVSKPDVKLN